MLNNLNEISIFQAQQTIKKGIQKIIQMYQIIKLIGRGANGDVFLAKKIQDNSIQVIKKLKIRDITQREQLTIQTQLKLLKQFKHVNIVPFKDSYIDTQGYLNIVMGYCQGGDLNNLIQESEGKKFEQKLIIQWIVQLTLSIYYLHQKRVLHRDIKTQNVFITNGKVMLGDFGVSKVLDQAADLAMTHIGTPYYMSPEQYRQKPYSYKSDIWALGCIIYQMCNHKHVFEALTINALAVKVLKGIYAPVSQQYSKQLRGLISELLKQNPKDRPSIRQILTKPFLFGKVQNYMKKVYSQKNKYEPQMIQSLVNQASSLGFSLQQVSVKKENLTKKSKSESKLQANKQKLKQQSYKKYEKLNQQLKKQIQQRNRAQEQLKNIQKNRNQKKKSHQKLTDKSHEKHNFHKPNIKKEQASSVSVQRNSKAKIKIQDINIAQIKDQSHQKQEIGKNFKIEEQYDMDYEQYSDKDEQDNNKNVQVQRKNEQQPNLRKVQKVQEVKQEKIKIQQPKNISIKNINQNKVQKNKQKQIKKQKQVKKQLIVHNEQQKQKQKQKQQTNSKKNEPQGKVNLDQLQKQIQQKTSIIHNIRNEISKLDFVLSSDSQTNQKQEKLFNPAYTRMLQRINDLKQKVMANMGRNQYTAFLEYVRSHIGKAEREKVIQMTGQSNIGIWLIAQNIVHMEKVISKIPTYCC